MKPAEPTLAFVQACAVLPTGQTSVAQWQQAALADHTAEVSSTYRVLTRWQFGEVGQQAAAWCADQAVRPYAQPQARFACEPSASQADMAEAAVKGLMDALPEKPACGVAVYATSGVDENFFQSSISRLVCGMGMSRVPHFGVAQWQGASWIGAMDIIASLSAESDGDHYAALMVCAEKWPLPFPRVLSLPAVMGDGAAALWIERVGGQVLQPALVCVDTGMRSNAPYVTLPDAAQATLPDVGRARILADARELMGALLVKHALQPDDVQGWLPSGLGRDWDRALQDSLGLDGLSCPPACENESSGYLSAAAGPVAIERLLSAMRDGQVADGARFLSWGMSLGGTVGVALLQARFPQARGASA